MTDAREIIAPDGKALIAEAITDYFGERCDGFETTCMTCQAWASWDRILGKDELDPVTVEKCAEVIEILARQLKENDRFLKPEGVSELAAAIRAIGWKA